MKKKPNWRARGDTFFALLAGTAFFLVLLPFKWNLLTLLVVAIFITAAITYWIHRRI